MHSPDNPSFVFNLPVFLPILFDVFHLCLASALMIISYHGLHIHITGSLTQDEKKLSKSWIITALSLSHVVLSIVLQGKCRYLRQIYIHYTYYEISLWTNIKCMKKKMVYRQRFPNLLGVFALNTFYGNSHFETSRSFTIQKSLLLFPYPPYNLPKHFFLFFTYVFLQHLNKNCHLVSSNLDLL